MSKRTSGIVSFGAVSLQLPTSDLPSDTEAFDLTHLAEKYALRVPFRIKVVNGFMATSNAKDPTLVVDEVYTVHLVRESIVVKVSCAEGEYFIPITSASKFGYINDENKFSLTYKNIEELVNSNPQPKIVAVRRTHRNANGSIVVKEGDILSIKDVIVPKLWKSRRTVVKAYNFSLKKEISLNIEMDIPLTTDPQFLQLYLTDLIQHVELPSECIIFPENSSLTSSLTSTKLKLVQLETQRSVIVSLFQDNPSAHYRRITNYIEIPTRINITVSIIETKEDERIYQQIMSESRDLFQSYNPSQIRQCVDSNNDDAYMTQAHFFAEVRRDEEQIGLAKFAPEYYEHVIHKDGTIRRGEQQQPASDLFEDSYDHEAPSQSVYDSVDELNSLSVWMTQPYLIPEPLTIRTLSRSPSPVISLTRCPPALPPRRSSHPLTAAENSRRLHKYEKLSEETLLRPSSYEPTVLKTPDMNHMDCSVDVISIVSSVNEIKKTLANVEKVISEIVERQSDLESEVEELKDANRNYEYCALGVHRDMNPSKVADVLSSNGLSQYRDVFLKEHIDGETFAVLDEDILNNELGITSKLHKIRLLNLFKEK